MKDNEKIAIYHYWIAWFSGLKYGVAHCYALKKNIVGSMFIMKVSPIAFSTMSIKSRSKMGWF